MAIDKAEDRDSDTKQIRLLLADDDKGYLAPIASELAANNCSVVLVDDTEVAVRELSEGDFDVAVIDLLMPPDHGTSILRHIVDNKLAVRSAILSSYSHIRELNKTQLVKESGATVFDKAKLKLDDKHSRRQFAQDLIEIASSSTDEIHSSLLAEAIEVSAIDMDFESFQSRSLEDRAALSALVYETHRSAIEREFNEGAIWICYRGSSRAPWVAKRWQEVPSTTVIEQRAATEGFSPFLFLCEVQVEDFRWGHDCDGQNTDYPTIGLAPRTDAHAAGESSESQKLIHFDTGCPMTFFRRADLEALLGHEVSGFPTVVQTNHTRLVGGEKPPKAVYSTVPLLLVSKGQTKLIDLNAAVAVTDDDWGKLGLTRNCITRCSSYRSGEKLPCKFRWGLVGRNIVIDHKIHLVLDGESRTTYLLSVGGNKKQRTRKSGARRPDKALTGAKARGSKK